MMNEKKSYKVHIFDDTYFLLSDQSEVFVKEAADMVDMLMKEIDHHATIIDAKKIAVLAALRMADTLLTRERTHDDEHKKYMALIEYIDQELAIAHL